MPPNLPPCARLPLRFDAEAMRRAVDALPGDAWQSHFNTGYYEGDWSGVALRAFDDAPLPLAPGQGATRDTAHCDAFWSAQLRRLDTGLRGVRLLRLGPGGRIREHCDYDLGRPDGDLRVHVPIVTDDRVDFLLDNRRVPMRTGECWFLDLSRPHRVENHGGIARIHLVIDCRRSPWLLAQIAAGLADTPPCRPSRGGEAFAALRERVHADPALQEALAAQADADAFVDAVLALATDGGHRFGREDVRAAMAQGLRDWREQWLA
ncbi:aspartyl beta-hydroxylase [Frateuria sp. Soil773]|uniref:aspartyl/asparaginyl beta-hydroxylase domain-containing protein n=1 Tax=Frateuria sp. Soil773 TaxID=1736407 RepID=UPI0006F2A163|nr:aspartyl/asparaginyl beta-hydroxylase domain-containing protein [Frateuria sp. Soil773]KRF02076.1 aspartyl beta-hydroxylase [Frateuria sp. Soil773]